ncbi:LiaF transmembrane domain-containing protein [Thermophagus sp. OGC60D27]|uniref:LiaF transmembrane domain-containing protein n=1 Tax=Thermophagus sp. OGC60D27 TaxID=3458415 RepID=UPI004037EA92
MEPHTNPSYPKNNHSSIGIVLIFIGAVILAGNLGWIPASLWNILYSWPSIFLIAAAVNLGKQKLFPAIIFFLIWLVIVLPGLFPDIDIAQYKMYWPLLLILAGLLFLNIGKKRMQLFKNKKRHPQTTEFLEEVAVFSGTVRRIDSKNFRGGEIISIFGGNEIYFNQSTLSPEGAVIQMVSIFGGTKLIVPRDWRVHIEVTSVLGGFADKRVFEPNETESQSMPILTIKGVIVFGGGELSNY